MWAPLILFLVVGLTSAETGWKAGSEYSYELRGRTLTGLSQAADQYSGVNIRAKLQIQAKSDDTLSIQVQNAEFAEIHSNLSSGWTSEIPDDHLHYTKLEMSNKPFEVILQNGVVDRMVVSKDTPVWERNMLKAIVSLLQVDTNGENLKSSKHNLLPSGENFFGNFKTMEDSVHGKYETIYDISELPEYIIESRPEMVPLPKLRGSGKIIDIVKTRNFSSSDQHVEYHHSMGGAPRGEPASNHMGDFLSRSSISRIILSGTNRRYVIQSSVTTEKIMVAPHLYNKQKGLVASRMNLTLEAVRPITAPAPQVENPLDVKDLVYDYQAQAKRSNTNSAESASASQENDLKQSALKKKAIKNAMVENIRRSSESSSSESSSSSSSSSSESSESLNSSEEYYHEISSLEEAPRASLLPFHIGFNGQLIHQAKAFNAEEEAIKKSRDIASEIQTPGAITGAATLSKYITLTRLIRTMSAQQVQKIREKLYQAQAKSQARKSPENSQDSQAWAVYRDAVSQAGTGPALLTIKAWIKERKVQGAEAAQLVSALSNAARLPTKQYMEAFFEMVKENENVNRLNTSAILSFGDLVRKAFVDKKEMHSRYPVHMYGPTNQQHEAALDKYIKYLDAKLHQAIQEGDSPKAQTFITALGYIAHPTILASFEPYLEGQKPASNYQRFVMIASLDKMTKAEPKRAQAVLYRIYQNMGESPEIRATAVMQLMKTKPSAQMLQRMAQQTNTDVSKQVNAAVKSAIQSSASQQINKYNKQSVENARSAVELLTPEEFGLQSTMSFIKSYLVKEQSTGYKHQLSAIDSRDSFLPKAVSYSLKRNLGGYKRDSHEIKFMASSVDYLLEQLSDQIQHPSSGERRNKQKPNRGQEQSGWSSEKVYQMLGFEAPTAEELEGSIQVSALGSQWYLPFNNYSIQQLPQIAQEIGSYIQSGKSFNFTKIYNQYSYELAFPTAMGIPFTYSMDVPTVVSLSGSAMASLQRQSKQQNQKQQNDRRSPVPERLRLDGEYDMTYSTKKQGQMGFVAPFNSKVYASGLEHNMEVRIPVKASAGYDMRNQSMDITIEALRQGQDEKLFEFSSNAYTTSHSVLDMKPLRNMEATRQISARRPYHFNQTIGENATGIAFEVSGSGDGQPLNLAQMLEKLERHDPVSLFLFGEVDDQIQNSNMTVTYNASRSSAERLTLAFQYSSEAGEGRRSANKHNRGANQENLALASAHGDRKKRHQELVKNALSGIKDGEAHAMEISAAFEGKQERKEYVMGVAYASSPVSSDARLLAYFNNQTYQPQPQHVQIGLQRSKSGPSMEVGLQLEMSFPKVPLVNFREALGADPTSKVSGRVDFVSGQQQQQQASYICLEGVLSASPQRKDYLQSHPLAKLCQKQMEQGLKVQPACSNVTIRANYLDTYRFTVSYANLPEQVQNWTHKAYGAARHFGYWYNNETSLDLSSQQQQEGQLEMRVNFTQGLRRMNVSIETPSMQSTFQDVPVHQWLRPAIVIHPQYTWMERLSRKIFRGQHGAQCMVDQGQITTFDNRTYQLGEKGNVLVQSYYSAARNWRQERAPQGYHNFTIAMERESGQQEVVIAVEENILCIKPNSGRSAIFQFNDKNVAVSQGERVPLRDNRGTEVMEVMQTADVHYTVRSREVGFQLIWVGNSVVIQLDGSLRGKVRGLCGNFDGEEYNDFTTPAGYMVNNTEAFAASYSMGQDLEARQQQPQQGYRQEIIMGDVISEADKTTKSAQKAQKADLKVKNSKEIEDNFVTGYRVKVIQEPTRTCFSLKAQMLCGAKAKASKLIEKVVDFHCVTKSIASKHWEKMVEQGATPDFTQKGSNFRTTLKVPEKCEAL